MPRLIGVVASDYIAAGPVEENRVTGEVAVFPANGDGRDILGGMHADEIVNLIAEQIEAARKGEPVESVGVGFPGIIRNGVVEESPNLPQMKGQNLASMLKEKGVEAAVHVRLLVARLRVRALRLHPPEVGAHTSPTPAAAQHS